MKKILLFSLCSTLLFGNNCNNLKEEKELCKWIAKEKSISENYIYRTFQNPLFNVNDEKTLRLIQPKEIRKHRNNEKKANKDMSKYVDRIVENIKQNKEVYEKAERKFSVNKEIIAGILMKETRLGSYKPKHSALQTLSTIYRNIKPNTKRNKWLYKLSKNNLRDLVDYCNKTGIKPYECDFKSSYIGAIGYPQFMPSSFSYIVPYKGKYSYLDNLPDSIMSIGNYLSKRGNYDGLFNFNQIDNIEKIENEWYSFSDLNDDASFSYSKNGKYKCFSCNKWELREMKNYLKDIMKYNNSSNYALGVFGLAWRVNQELQKEKFSNQQENITSEYNVLQRDIIVEETIEINKKPKEEIVKKELKLTKPKKIFHIVEKGDTFYNLSKKYNISINKLKSLNNKNNYSLSIGEELRIY